MNLRTIATITLSTLSVLFAPGERAEAQVRARQYLVYQVQIKGPAISNVAGAPAINRSGYLYLTSTITNRAVAGDVNGLDFYLVSGSPAGSPSAGAIVYATNSLAVGDGGYSFRGAQLDLAYVARVRGNSLHVEPFTTLTRQYLYFTARNSLFASLYQVENGSIDLNFNSNLTSISSGLISLRGRAAGYPSSPQVLYLASITGRYLGTVTY